MQNSDSSGMKDSLNIPTSIRLLIKLIISNQKESISLEQLQALAKESSETRGEI